MSNVYDMVTDRIMELLEQGEIPWRKPWRSSGGPRNLITRKPYRGINSFLLNCSAYGSPYWLTFKQAKDKGGYIRKGERSTIVVFYKWINTVSQPSEEAGFPEDDKQKLIKIPMLRYYQVFNLDQAEGIKPPSGDEVQNPFTPIKTAEQIIQNMQHRPEILYGGDRACYSPHLDKVTLPSQEAFHSPEAFYATCFHELAHATGHSSRLARKGITDPCYFGSHEYSHEELVSEFSASLLCGVAGIEQETLTNSAAYIRGWLSVLKGDKRLAVIAAGQAQRAADYILNIQPADEQQDH